MLLGVAGASGGGVASGKGALHRIASKDCGQQQTRLRCGRGVLPRCSIAVRVSGGVIDQRTVVVSMVDGGSSKTGRSSVVVLLCERALWPGEANAQPPVGRALIGGAAEMQCTHTKMRVLCRWCWVLLSTAPLFVLRVLRLRLRRRRRRRLLPSDKESRGGQHTKRAATDAKGAFPIWRREQWRPAREKGAATLNPSRVPALWARYEESTASLFYSQP